MEDAVPCCEKAKELAAELALIILFLFASLVAGAGVVAV